MADEPIVTTTTTQAPPPAAWYEGKADAETVGYLQNKGWATATPVDVALNAIKAHREAEKFIGAPANELARIPKADSDEATVKAFWEKLGAPANGKEGYDFSAIKNADGTPVTAPVLDKIREVAAELHLPKDAATRVAAAILKYEADKGVEGDAVNAGKLAEQKAALAKNWGINAEVNKVVAQSAASKLGVDPAAVTALESVIGYDKVMDMFLKIGQSIGEDKFVVPPGGGNGVMTVEAAKSRLADLKADNEWSNRYLNGGAAEKREMAGLVAIIASATGPQ
jgi:hypothetical protein